MNHDQIQDWLRTKLAARLRIPPQALDVHRSLDEYGLDSMEAVALTGELETWLGRRVEPTAFWDHRSVSQLAAFLAGEATAPAATQSEPLTDDDVADLLGNMARSRS